MDIKLISARQFIAKLRVADDASVKVGNLDGNFEIILKISSPESQAGTFRASHIDSFEGDFEWYCDFVKEITYFLMVEPHRRKNMKLRIRLPWAEGLDYYSDDGEQEPVDILYNRADREVCRGSRDKLQDWLRKKTEEQPDRYYDGGYFVRVSEQPAISCTVKNYLLIQSRDK
jgi:hypothetical protein